MISERNISEKFSAIWKQNFPLLTSNFIRMINETHIYCVNSEQIFVKEEVRYDLISEVAFNIAEVVFVNEEMPLDVLNKNNGEIISESARGIWRSKDYSKKDLVLSDVEKQEIISIAKNISEFIKNTHEENVLFKPVLRGYSFIPDLLADISIGNSLFEIKSVNRNFKSSDLKQLLLYLALKQVSDKENWEFAGIYNPRKGTVYKFNVANLVNKLTGGKTPNEAFEDLLSGLNRDIEIDSKF